MSGFVLENDFDWPGWHVIAFSGGLYRSHIPHFIWQ
jgi:hypothetical protein